MSSVRRRCSKRTLEVELSKSCEVDDEGEVTSEVAHEKEETKSVAPEEVLASG